VQKVMRRLRLTSPNGVWWENIRHMFAKGLVNSVHYFKLDYFKLDSESDMINFSLT
jgi:hypothetical protein